MAPPTPTGIVLSPQWVRGITMGVGVTIECCCCIGTWSKKIYQPAERGSCSDSNTKLHFMLTSPDVTRMHPAIYIYYTHNLMHLHMYIYIDVIKTNWVHWVDRDILMISGQRGIQGEWSEPFWLGWLTHNLAACRCSIVVVIYKDGKECEKWTCSLVKLALLNPKPKAKTS